MKVRSSFKREKEMHFRGRGGGHTHTHLKKMVVTHRRRFWEVRLFPLPRVKRRERDIGWDLHNTLYNMIALVVKHTLCPHLVSQYGFNASFQ